MIAKSNPSLEPGAPKTTVLSIISDSHFLTVDGTRLKDIVPEVLELRSKRNSEQKTVRYDVSQWNDYYSSHVHVAHTECLIEKSESLGTSPELTWLTPLEKKCLSKNMVYRRIDFSSFDSIINSEEPLKETRVSVNKGTRTKKLSRLRQQLMKYAPIERKQSLLDALLYVNAYIVFLFNWIEYQKEYDVISLINPFRDLEVKPHLHPSAIDQLSDLADQYGIDIVQKDELFLFELGRELSETSLLSVDWLPVANNVSRVGTLVFEWPLALEGESDVTF